jgi:glycosyltransferase involved in cell wall biosynthesis
MSHPNYKLFVDAHVLDKGFNGAHTYVRELYRGLLSRHGDVEVFFGTYDPAKVWSLFPGYSRVHVLKYRSAGYLRYLLDIPRFIRKHQIDLAHYQYMSVPWRTAALSMVTQHDVLYEDYPGQFPLGYRWSRQVWFTRSFKKADLRMTVSPYSQDRLSERYGLPMETIHILPPSLTWQPGPGTKEEAQKRIRERYGLSDFLLYVSRIEPRKNHAQLLDAWLSLECYKQNISLVCIGADSLEVPALKKRLKGLNTSQRSMVYWLPKVSLTDLEAFYKACRVFVYPSKAEGFGLPPLEAALCKAPVVCSRGTALDSFTFFDPYRFDPDRLFQLEDMLGHSLKHPPGDDFLQSIADQVRLMYGGPQSADLFYSLIRQTFFHGTEHRHTGHQGHPQPLRGI